MDRQRLNRLKRGGRVLAPTIFTMGNAACGFVSILVAHVGDFVVAGTAILLGIVFDMLDGRVARLVHGESEFGVEFDSLADFLTFGVAPAFLMYALFLKDYGIPGVGVAFLFALCGGMRLARFEDLVAALASLGGRDSSLELLRGGEKLTVSVTPTERTHRRC